MKGALYPHSHSHFLFFFLALVDFLFDLIAGCASFEGCSFLLMRLGCTRFISTAFLAGARAFCLELLTYFYFSLFDSSFYSSLLTDVM